MLVMSGFVEVYGNFSDLNRARISRFVFSSKTATSNMQTVPLLAQLYFFGIILYKRRRLAVELQSMKVNVYWLKIQENLSKDDESPNDVQPSILNMCVLCLRWFSYT